MMGELIGVDFGGRDESQAHLSGRARCCACQHEWVAVAPTGSVWLECPSCRTEKGRYLHDVTPAEAWWHCRCGCDVFRVNRTFVTCVNCGLEQRF